MAMRIDVHLQMYQVDPSLSPWVFWYIIGRYDLVLSFILIGFGFVDWTLSHLDHFSLIVSS